MPSYERFYTADSSLPEIYLGLEVDLQLTVRDRLFEVALQLPERRLLFGSIGAIDVVIQLSILRVFQGEIRATKETAGIVRVLRVYGNAKCHVDQKAVLTNLHLRLIFFSNHYGRIRDFSHRLEGDQNGEATVRQPNNWRSLWEHPAKRLGVLRAELARFLDAECRTYSVKRIELTQQQGLQFPRRLLAKELFYKANSRGDPGTRGLRTVGSHLSESSLIHGQINRFDQISARTTVSGVTPDAHECAACQRQAP